MDEALWASAKDLLAEVSGASESLEGAAPGKSREDTSQTDFLDYAAYFDLVLTPPGEHGVTTEAKAKAVEHLQRRLSAMNSLEPQSSPPRITNFSTEHYSTDELEQMRRWWDIEPANRMGMTRATDEEFERTRKAIEVAAGYLRDAAPELHGEFETIVRDVILSRPDGTNLINYSGASSFPVWGAMTINAETQVEWSQNYRQIVHETGHNLLFGLARDQRLVLDDPAGRARSPIRADPRPIDGIFHAAFVSAREALAFDALLCCHEDTGCLTPDDAEIIADLLEISVLAFWDCVGTLRSGAQLSEFGETVLADCEAYMTANFELQSC